MLKLGDVLKINKPQVSALIVSLKYLIVYKVNVIIIKTFEGQYDGKIM